MSTLSWSVYEDAPEAGEVAVPGSSAKKKSKRTPLRDAAGMANERVGKSGAVDTEVVVFKNAQTPSRRLGERQAPNTAPVRKTVTFDFSGTTRTVAVQQQHQQHVLPGSQQAATTASARPKTSHGRTGMRLGGGDLQQQQQQQQQPFGELPPRLTQGMHPSATAAGLHMYIALRSVAPHPRHRVQVALWKWAAKCATMTTRPVAQRGSAARADFKGICEERDRDADTDETPRKRRRSPLKEEDRPVQATIGAAPAATSPHTPNRATPSRLGGETASAAPSSATKAPKLGVLKRTSAPATPARTPDRTHFPTEHAVSRSSSQQPLLQQQNQKQQQQQQPTQSEAAAAAKISENIRQMETMLRQLAVDASRVRQQQQPPIPPLPSQQPPPQQQVPAPLGEQPEFTFQRLASLVRPGASAVASSADPAAGTVAAGFARCRAARPSSLDGVSPLLSARSGESQATQESPSPADMAELGDSDVPLTELADFTDKMEGWKRKYMPRKSSPSASGTGGDEQHPGSVSGSSTRPARGFPSSSSLSSSSSSSSSSSELLNDR